MKFRDSNEEQEREREREQKQKREQAQKREQEREQLCNVEESDELEKKPQHELVDGWKTSVNHGSRQHRESETTGHAW